MKASYDFRQGRRGAVIPGGSGKTRITMRLDNDVLAWFRQRTEKAGGGSYQALINAALREHIANGRLEISLRRILREELHRAS